jgi:outer membrane immunogenic protein
MKKIFTILTVVALTTTVSFAQFGIKAGLNLANVVNNDDDSDNGMKLGMIIGANYNAELSDVMSLDVTVAFKQSGTEETMETSESLGGITIENDFSGTIALNYLDISPSLSFNLSDAMALSFGPYLAFALSGKSKYEITSTISGTGTSDDGTTTQSDENSIDFGDGDDDDGIKAMDFGLNIGASYSINDAISINAGYSMGLTNLIYLDDDYDYGDDEPSIKNTGINVGVTYSFGGRY